MRCAGWRSTPDEDDDWTLFHHGTLIEAIRNALLAQHDKPAVFFEGGIQSVNDHLTAVASRPLFLDWITTHVELKNRLFHDAPWWAAIAALGPPPAAQEARELARTTSPDIPQPVGGASLLLRSHALREVIKSEAHFDFEDVYFDDFGALVVEYYLKKDRLTVVFEEEQLTVMTMIGDKVATKVFDRPNDNGVLEHIKQQLKS